jgi:excisionase family DNA binding protein
MTPLAYTITESCVAARVSRSSIYDAINSGSLRAVKQGRRTLILANDLRNWIEHLPALRPRPRQRASQAR